SKPQTGTVTGLPTGCAPVSRPGSPMERVPRPPLRQPILIRDVLAEQQSVLRGLPQRGEIPVALELVRWLVVVLADVLPVGLLAETRRLADELRGVPD